MSGPLHHKKVSTRLLWSNDLDDSQREEGFVNGMVAPYILCHSGTINRHYLSGAAIMNVKTIGIDLAKEVSRSTELTNTASGCSTSNSNEPKCFPFLPASLHV